MRHDADDDVMMKLRHARRTLEAEQGAEYDYYAERYTEELADEVLDIGFALLEANERIERLIRSWRRWRRLHRAKR